MNANAILVAYMIENDTRVERKNLTGQLAKMQRYKDDVYFSTFVAAVLCLTLTLTLTVVQA